MRHIAGGYVIDDDPARIDGGAAVAFLTTQAYWGRWRGEADIRRQISEAWRVVGAYDQAGAMVGFARAFGDGGSAYLADVYVLPGQRGAGLGQAIVRVMIEDGPGSAQRWMLHTSDAHGLYRLFGFTQPAGPPSRYLERSPGPGGHGGAGGAGGGGAAPPGAGGVGGGPPPRATQCASSRCGPTTCPACWPPRRAAVTCTAGPRCRRMKPRSAGMSRRRSR